MADPKLGPVLIVDDEHVVRVRLRVLLEAAGYEVFTATDGLTALALLERRAFSPKLILLDLVMPIMDGWQFLEAVRDEPEHRAAAVVLFTAADDDCVPEGVTRLRKDASDAAILEVVRESCRVPLS